MITRKEFFNEVYKKPYFKSLMNFLNEQYVKEVVYPPRSEMWNAFRLTSLDELKVVILGQDPYPNPNQAMGLSFSVPQGVELPPSLENIYKEIEDEFGFKKDHSNGDLTYLAKQGVLLLNPVLTVIAHRPLSHKIPEYDDLFKDVMALLNGLDKPLCFLLWGNNARRYDVLLTNPKHLVIETAHPSPLSANRGGWFKSGCFKKCNEYLKENGIEEIQR
jgi:uracil-DNA glycosylase